MSHCLKLIVIMKAILWKVAAIVAVALLAAMPQRVLANGASHAAACAVTDDVFEDPESMAQFPGGQAALMEFIQKNVRYPREALRSDVGNKRVIVQFVIEKDGTVTEPRVVRSAGEAFDAEALRLCGLLPKFTPARMYGKAVRQQFTLPIAFINNGTNDAEAADTDEPVRAEQLYSSVNVYSSFPGGLEGLMTFLGENIQYPESARQQFITGTVLLEFIVEKDGHVGDVTVLRSVDEALDAEAVRVCKMLPRFKTARDAETGEPIRVKYTLPVRFKLTD